MTYYKFLTEYNKGEYSQSDYNEYLPKDNNPGKWLPTIDGDIVLCRKGYHACTINQLTYWINAHLFEVEFSGDIVIGTDKIAGSRMRFVRKIEGWNDCNARLYACWCAEKVLPFYEERHPTDKRLYNTIEISRLFAHGKATPEELREARIMISVIQWEMEQEMEKELSVETVRALGAARAVAGSIYRIAWLAAWYAEHEASNAANNIAKTRNMIKIQCQYLVKMLGLDMNQEEKNEQIKIIQRRDKFDPLQASYNDLVNEVYQRQTESEGE